MNALSGLISDKRSDKRADTSAILDKEK